MADYNKSTTMATDLRDVSTLRPNLYSPLVSCSGAVVLRVVFNLQCYFCPSGGTDIGNCAFLRLHLTARKRERPQK